MGELLDWQILGGAEIQQGAFKSVLSLLWRMEGRVTFKEVQDNLWLVEFSDGEDKIRVLEGRPWSFERQIFMLQDFDGQTPPSQMSFTHSPVLIQVHDMPLVCMTNSVGSKIGASIGCWKMLMSQMEVRVEGDS